MPYTYIVQCADNSYYTGWTNDLKTRLAAHNSGIGARYTRSRLPVTMVYYEEHDTESQARKREWAIKQLTRQAKAEMVKAFAAYSSNDNTACYKQR